MILDLTSLETSEIKYKINPYPDGQRDLVISDFEKWQQVIHSTKSDGGGSKVIRHYYPYVVIKSRLNNMEDLGLIICANQALKTMGVKEIYLFTPYIMGLRSDRLFQPGGVKYIKDVLAPMLNSQNFERITCIDPHSFVAQNCINNLQSLDNTELVKFALKDIYGFETGKYCSGKSIILSPDDGASKKIYKLAEQIEFTGKIVTCSKDRDLNGKLTKTVVPINIADLEGKDMIIIDDICDGGGTFINMVKALNEQIHKYNVACENEIIKPKIYLIVTHGVFSKGYEELGKYFDGIYCTNSYKQVTDYVQNHLDKDIPTKVKQLNIFKQ